MHDGQMLFDATTTWNHQSWKTLFFPGKDHTQQSWYEHPGQPRLFLLASKADYFYKAYSEYAKTAEITMVIKSPTEMNIITIPPGGIPCDL